MSMKGWWETYIPLIYQTSQSASWSLLINIAPVFKLNSSAHGGNVNFTFKSDKNELDALWLVTDLVGAAANSWQMWVEDKELGSNTVPSHKPVVYMHEHWRMVVMLLNIHNSNTPTGIHHLDSWMREVLEHLIACRQAEENNYDKEGRNKRNGSIGKSWLWIFLIKCFWTLVPEQHEWEFSCPFKCK